MTFKKIKERIVHYAIYLTIGFILLSTALSFWNRYVTYDTRSILDKAQTTKGIISAIEEQVVNPMIILTYRYSTQPKDSDYANLQEVMTLKDSLFTSLHQLLLQQKVKQSNLNEVQRSVNLLASQSKSIVTSVARGEPAPSHLLEFVGKSEYHRLKLQVFKLLDEIKSKAQSDYEWSIADNAIIQVILILLSVPILIIASSRLGREVRNNAELLNALDNSNREYLYDDAQPLVLNSKGVVEKSIANLTKAFSFVQHVSKGEHQSARALIPQQLMQHNQQTLMGALVDMSMKLEKNEEADRQRQWIAEGLNQFYEIVRVNQHDLTALADKLVVFLVKYLHSQQGSLFILNTKVGEPFLELLAAYAYERKKWLEKKIQIGDGLLGQAYLEGEHILLTDIPANYISITSGLGHTLPRCLLIMPFRYNEKTEAVFEVASFTKYEPHQIEFLKKAGEFIAGTLQNVNKNIEMQRLLMQSQEQAETMRAQEEELRQNMEELEATNEAMRRKEQEIQPSV